MKLSHDQQDTLRRIDTRLRLIEHALERAFREGGATALAADLRFLGVADILIDGRPMEEMGELLAHALTHKLSAFRQALDRAVSEISD
ncbi:hypothetical protein [Donghicola tyrosinivorans]|uniref:Uncharacterized protein n=1 Tax=Donghicola tyrosinivorans TaxID=1652492 RepID=A0A2T0WGF0_9RHOB|nr:hypothetical protein [Donghicola tyrosinivorans]PRY85781.1 hypothetical protein CLV74_1143 [Donghicola tyrosinivorans]